MNDLLCPQGYRFATLQAGIKKSGKPDLALIVSDHPAAAAGVFTRNRVVAAPVTLCRERLPASDCRAILINSGNANACTGAQGLEDGRRTIALLSQALGVAERQVLVSSTGVIGVPLPMDRFIAGIPQLVSVLGQASAPDLAQAMMTTDAFPKAVSCELSLPGGAVKLLAVAKGAGMIHPDMGTMLSYVMTDACIAPEVLQQELCSAVDQSFNAMTVDGDMSTNDTVVLLANGCSGVTIAPGTEALSLFRQALHDALLDLARMIVRDGEGATKLVTIRVEGARDLHMARTVAMAIATSSLVKTAFFGQDPNWGRILAAAGATGLEIDPERMALFFDDVAVVRNGLGLGAEVVTPAAAVLRLPEFTVTLDLGLGEASAFYLSSDLTYDYVRINAEYHT